MNTAELISIIKDNDIAIYGAGYAAQNFYMALQLRDLDKRVKCFIVTDSGKAQGLINGIPIRAAVDVVKEKNIYICVAVHEAVKNEIEDNLSKLNADQYVWVHPNIMELALGTPLEFHKLVETNRIVQSQQYDNYAFAIRYLAIENYYKKNNAGYDIYLKALNLQCEPSTASKRLNNFIKLIDDWDKSGYRQEPDILIDENNRLIDGTHRVSLACYHETKCIFCTIFPYSENYSKMIKQNHFLTKYELEKNGFTQCEIKEIERVQETIRKKGNCCE